MGDGAARSPDNQCFINMLDGGEKKAGVSNSFVSQAAYNLIKSGGPD